MCQRLAGIENSFNSDSAVYGGANVGNGGGLVTQPIAAHGFDQSLVLTIPPLGFVLLKT